MHHNIRWGLLLSLLLVTTGFAAPAEPKQQLSELLGQLNTMTANFEQTVYGSNEAVLQRSDGRMALKRPGQFRWQINTPTQQVLYANGDKLWIYDVDLEQATLQRLDSNVGITPAQLLMGSTDYLSEQFNVSVKNDSDGQWFRLTPKDDSDLFEFVDLHFNKGALLGMRLQDNLGQITDLQFNSVKLNPSIPANTFKFTPPKGVDVINQIG